MYKSEEFRKQFSIKMDMGNLSNVDHSKSDRISLTVEKCIERISLEEGFVSYNVNVHNISTNGGNYFANLQAVDVKGRTNDGEREINLFLKNRILNINVTSIPFDKIYKREAFFYNEIVPLYNKLQDETRIPAHERFIVAKSHEESNIEVIILEDLSKRGYWSNDRREPISFRFAESSVKQLAKFHALSFVLLDREPEYFNQAIKSLNILIEPDLDFETLMDNMCDAAVKFLEGDAQYRLAKYKPSLKNNCWKLNKVSQTIPSCLCHGDFRANNIMIIEKNGEIKELVAIDFQLIHYGSPVMDLIYFIFGGSDRKLRMNHLEELKGVYYETFKSFLEYFDINADHVYSKEQFEREYRENLDYGIATFMLCVPFMFCDDDAVPDLQSGLSGVNVNINNEEYKERLRGVVADFIQWGYF